MGYPHDVLVPAAQLLRDPVDGLVLLQLPHDVQPLPPHLGTLEDGSPPVIEGPTSIPAHVLLD